MHSPFIHLLRKAFFSSLREDEISYEQMGKSRRKFLRDAGLMAGGMALLPNIADAFNLGETPHASIAIIGAGMAGLNAAYQLKKLGLKSTVYEASARAGGRMFTIKDKFGKGITTDLGGEFVDSDHTEIFQLAKELKVDFYNLKLDNLDPKTFYFDGKHLNGEDLKRAIHPFARLIEKDVKSLPRQINFTSAPSFQHLDNLSISEYINSIGIKGWLNKLLNVVLTMEYGMDTSEQSAINFLIMFTEPVTNEKDYELFGDEHEVFKIKGGSQHLSDKLYQQVKEQVLLTHKLTSISATKTKKYELSFDQKGIIKKVTADYVIMAIPFTILRKIKFDVPMPSEKRKSIDELGYGNSGKFIMGLNNKPWRKAGKAGYTFTDLEFGCGWDSSQMQSDTEGSFTLFGGGRIINTLCNEKNEALAARIAPQLDKVYPGALKDYNSKTVKFCWSQYPYTMGGYSTFKKGQWSTIAGWEAVPAGNIYFAGEHVSLTCQGYMNGAAQTGRIAAEMVAKIAAHPPRKGGISISHQIKKEKIS
jgi:monoamine oxidase